MDSPPASKRMTMSGPSNFGFVSNSIWGQNPNRPNNPPALNNNDNNCYSLEEPMEVHDKMREFQEARKKDVNSMKAKAKGWTELIDDEAEEQVVSKFQTCAVQKTLVIERGSESYFVTGSRKRKRALADEATAVKPSETGMNEGQVKQEEETDYDSEHSDISESGLDAEDLEYIKKPVEAKSQPPSDVDSNSIGNTVKPKTHKTSIKRMDELLKNRTDKDVYRFIANRLVEKKAYIVRRCIESLGRKYCEHMFRKTLKIEAKGGLLIKNQSRRRTPGGVFFYIVRADKKHSKEVLDEIFNAPPPPNRRDQQAGNGKNKANTPVATSIFEKMAQSRQNLSGAGVVGHAQMKKTIELEKKRKAVAEQIDAESYHVKQAVGRSDPRARSIISYDDDLFS